MLYRFKYMEIGDAYRIIKEKGGVITIPAESGRFWVDGIEIENKTGKPCYLTIWEIEE